MDKKERFSEKDVSLVAAVGTGLFIAAPFGIAVPAVFLRSIDFLAINYPKVLRDWIYMISAAIFLIAWVLHYIISRRNGLKFKDFIKKNPVVVVFAATVLWMFISQCVNGLWYALKGYLALSLEETFQMELGYIALLLSGAALVREEVYKKWLCRAHVLAGTFLVAAAFILWHTMKTSTFFYDWTERFSSIFTNTNYYGYYLTTVVALAAVLFINEKKIGWKIFAGVGFAANTVALSINDTTGAWVGCLAAMIFIAVTHFIVEKKFNWQVVAVIVVFAICLYIPGHILGTFEQTTGTLGKDIVSVASGTDVAGTAGSGRMRIWRATADIIKEHPLFGIGFEGVRAKNFVGPPYNIRPHNEFMQIALFHGIPALLLYFAGCLMVFIRALRKKASLDMTTLACLTAAFSYLVSSFFGLTVYSTAPYLFLFLGMGYVVEEEKKTEPVQGAKATQKTMALPKSGKKKKRK